MRLAPGVIGLSCALLLAACTAARPLSPPVPENLPPVPQQDFTTAEHDSEAKPLPVELPTVSGSLSPTGVLQLGNPDAPVVLLVFTNHACRYCREFHGHHLPRLTDAFVRSGQLRIDIAMHPLRKYPESQLGAMAMLCSAEHAAEMDRMLSELSPITNATVGNIVKQEGWGEVRFWECMQSDAPAEMLTRLQSLADSLGADLVPTFFINGEQIVGLPEYAELRATIDEAIGAVR